MRLWDRGFTENFVRFLRTPCFIEQLCGCFWKYVSEGMHRLLIPLRKGLLINKQNQRLDNSKQWWNRKFSKIIFGKVLKQPPAVFSKKRMFLKDFAIFTGKHLYWNLFLIKLQACKFLRTLILKNLCEQLLLKVINFFLNYSISWRQKTTILFILFLTLSWRWSLS